MRLSDLNHIKVLEDAIKRLSDATRHKMGKFKRPPVYNENQHQGIYLITDHDDQEVVYIGKTNNGTKENGVADRIWGHCAKDSDLQSSLGIDPKDIENYNVRTIEIKNSGDRGLAELYGIAIYAPKGNRYGHKGISIDLDDRMPST